MPLTLRVHEPRELLALVPFQLGFHPTESLVLVSLRPPEGRVGLVARADLGDVCDAGVGRAVSDRLVGHLVSDRAAAVVAVVYTHQPVPVTPSPRSAAWRAHEGVASAVAGLDPDHGLDLVGTWWVGPSGYRRLGCTDPGCCPGHGRPLDDLESTQVGAHMVLAGASVSGSREDLGQVEPAPEASRRRATAASAAWTRSRAADGLHGPAHLDWLERSLAVWRRALDGEVTAAELGQLGAALEDVVLRDAVLVSLVPGTDGLPDGVLRSVSGPVRGDGTDAAVGRAVAAVVDPASGVRPGEVTGRGRRALELLVAHQETPSAPARTLLALIAWWGGDSALARAHLDRGEVTAARYRLAWLLRRAIEVGMPPGWAAPGAA